MSSSQTRIRVFAFDASGTTIAADTSDSNFTITSGAARPVAVPDCNNNAPSSGTYVGFDGSRSTAPAGYSIASYAWDFGDGYTASVQKPFHAFTAAGTRTFQVTLTVTDSGGAVSYPSTMNVTVTGQALGTPPTTSMSADPVNLATGNFIYDHVDLTIPGIGFPFEFKRFYNSKDSRFTGAPLGCGWTHSYNLFLSSSNGSVNIVYGDGRSETYTNSAGVYVPETGIYKTLTTNAAGAFVLTTKEQTRYNFNSQGRLASIVDKNSNTLSVIYGGGGTLNAITNSAGRVITFVNDASNRIAAIVDPLNRTNSFAYNAQGDLVCATDPRGGTTRYGYDSDHQMTNAVDPNGNQFVRNVYNMNRVVESQKDALGNNTSFTYDFVTRETVVSNALGHRQVHKHDDRLRIVQIMDEAGNIQNFEYDDFNNRTKVIDKNRRTTSYTYDSIGNVTSKTTAPEAGQEVGNTTTIAYDSLNNPTNRVDAKAGLTRFTFDNRGNLTKTVNPQNCTNTVTYDARGLPIAIRDGNGNTLSNSYDTAGNLLSTWDALGFVRTFTFDSGGRKLIEADPNGATNRFSYDGNNNLIQSVDPLGFTNVFTYDANNNQILIQDARGSQTVKFYDPKDRLVSVRDALGGVISNAYDTLDRKIVVIDPHGNATRFAYDPVGNLVAVTNSLGQVTRYTYDANGNQLTLMNALGQVSSNEYDVLNRLISVTAPLGHRTSYSYDELGRRTQVTDANSQVTRFQHDSLGRLTNVIDAATGTVSFTYDNVGNRKTMKEPNGHATSFTYDKLNQLTQRTEPRGWLRYTYDSVGNRTQLMDGKTNVVNYSYDLDKRLTNVSYQVGGTFVGSVAFSYDAGGNRVRMVDSLGTTTYAYDALNRMTNCTDSFGNAVAYSYDANGNRSSMTYPGNKVVTYTYDALNRMATVQDWLGGVTTNTYDSAGNLALVRNPNGTTARYGFDDAGRLRSLTNAMPNASIISAYNLALDGVGNHLQSAQIDPIETLIPTQAVSYAYDNDNRLTNATGTAFSYDVNGNMLTQGADTFAYDIENRLTNALIGGVTNQYLYDGIGNRLRASRAGVTTRYILDINGTLAHVLAEANAAGTITAYYVYGRGLISRIDTNGTAAFYHYDVRGSTVALTDSGANVTDKYAFDPFGTVVNSVGTTANPFKYVGRYGVMDEGNGLAYIRARYYSPRLGRFVTKDPVTGKESDSQSLNRYIYALNNPVRLFDISGFSARESSGVAANQGTSDSNHSRLLDETRRARAARMARIQQYQAEALYWEQESIYWNATADVLQGANDALDTAMSLFTGSAGGVISGLTKQSTTLLRVLGYDVAARRVSTVNDVLKVGLAVKGVNDIVHAGSGLVAGFGAQGQNMIKDSGIKAFMLPEDNPIAEAYKTLTTPILDFGLDSLKNWASGGN
jgi:RHS repeat-associated protein